MSVGFKVLTSAKSNTWIEAISASSVSVPASPSRGIPVPFPCIAGSEVSDVIASLSEPNNPPASLFGSVSKSPSLSDVTNVDNSPNGPGPSGSISVVAPAISAVFV